MLPTLLALVAAAQVGGTPVPGPPTDVEIAIAARPPEAATAVRDDLEDLLSRRGLAARYRQLSAVDRDEVLRPAAEAPCALACIWIDLGVAKPTRAFVYLSATASAQVVIRSLPLPSGVDEVAREEVAQIVATSVEALRAGRPLPVAANGADVPLAKVVRAPPPAAPPTPGTLWLAGLGGGVAHEGASSFALPVASLSLVVGAERRAFTPALWISAGGFSGDVDGAPVDLRFHGAELAVLATLGTRATDGELRRRVVARIGFGPGVELREVTPSAASGTVGVALDPARLDASAFVRAAARLEIGLVAPVGLFVAAACDARLVSRRYTVDRDGMTDALFEANLLRPSLVVGLDARLGGEAAP